ncbi:MAG: hypothetical protein RRY69_03650, partial [Oscillospiraceae bacterium]
DGKTFSKRSFGVVITHTIKMRSDIRTALSRLFLCTCLFLFLSDIAPGAATAAQGIREQKNAAGI